MDSPSAGGGGIYTRFEGVEEFDGVSYLTFSIQGGTVGETFDLFSRGQLGPGGYWTLRQRGVRSGEEIWIEIDSLSVSEFFVAALDSDVDQDGLPDGFELLTSGCVLGGDPREGDRDLDGDGLTNRYEAFITSNVRAADSDGDGASDHAEVVGGGHPLKGHIKPIDLASGHYLEIPKTVLQIEASSNADGHAPTEAIDSQFEPFDNYWKSLAESGRWIRIDLGERIPLKRFNYHSAIEPETWNFPGTLEDISSLQVYLTDNDSLTSEDWGVSLNRFAPSRDFVGNVEFGQDGDVHYGRYLILHDPNPSANGGVSTLAELSVFASLEPVITRIDPIRTEVNRSSLPVEFEIGHLNHSINSLSLSVSSSNPQLVSSQGIEIHGAGTRRILVVSPEPNQIGNATITLRLISGSQVTQQDIHVSVEPVVDADADGLTRYEEEVLIGNSDASVSGIDSDKDGVNDSRDPDGNWFPFRVHIDQSNKPLNIALNGQLVTLTPGFLNPSVESATVFVDLGELVTFTLQSPTGVTLADQQSVLFTNVDDLRREIPWIPNGAQVVGNQLKLSFIPYRVQFDIYNDATSNLGQLTMAASDQPREFGIGGVVILPGPLGNSSYLELMPGSRVQWQVFENDVEKSRSQLALEGDTLSTTHLVSTVAGKQYSYQVTAKRILFQDPVTGVVVDTDIQTPAFSSRTKLIEIVSAEAAQLTVNQSKGSLVSDGNDHVDLDIFAQDQFGNPVSQATIDWFLETSPNARFEGLDETTRSNGRAYATLRTGVLQRDVRLQISVDSISTTIDIPVAGIQGTLTSNSSVVDAHLNQTIELTINAPNATDGAPVFWASSSGELEERSLIKQGVATASLRADPDHVGSIYVMAALGDRVFLWNGECTSSAPLYFKVENPALIPANSDANGNVYIGPDGSPIDLPLVNTTPVEIHGPPNNWVTVSFPSGLARANVVGMNPANQLQFNVWIGAQGFAAFQLQAEPLITTIEGPGWTHEFFEQGLIDIRADLRQATGGSLVAETDVKVIDPGTMAHLKAHFYDGMLGFVGGDTQTATGAVFAIGGGLFVVADVGAIVKNAARYAHFSSAAPNDLEFAISVIAIISSLYPPADPFVSGLRVIAQRLGTAKFALLGVLENRFIEILKLLPAGGSPWQSLESILIKGEVDFVLRLADDEVLTTVCGKICTSKELWESTVKATDNFGDSFVNVLKTLENNEELAKKFVDVVGGLKPSAVAGLRSRGALDEVMDTTLERLSDRVRPENLKKLLNNEIAFIGGYKQADFLVDARTIMQGNPNVGGFQGLVQELSRANDIPGAGGFIFEMQIGALLTKLGEYVVNISTTGTGRDAIDMVSKTTVYTAKKSFTALAGPSSRSEIQRVEKAIGVLGRGYDTAVKEGKPFSLAIQTGEVIPQRLLDWMASKNPPITVRYFPFRN